MSGAITITNFSGDQICAGTISDPCYAYVNLTANEDIFLYPIDYDPWGRNTLFEFSPAVESWRFQRSWGDGWRDVPLNETCTGTWCGAPNSDGVAYSYVLREGKEYQFRIVAYKESPYDTIKWAINYEDKEYLDPTWFGIDKFKEYETSIKLDTPDFLKEDFNDKYGIITINDKQIDKIVEYSLTSNTEQCTTKCSAEGRAVLYKDSVLFSDVMFIDEKGKEINLLSSQYWIKIDETYQVEIPSTYEKICYKNNTCYQVPIKWEKKNLTRRIWTEYNYEELDAGNYEWKLTGTKDASSNIDFLIEINGEILSEWAWWNGTGGTVTTDGDYTVHTFTINGTFEWEGDETNVSVLVIAGGGGGGNDNYGTSERQAGGGGAGGFQYETNFTLTEQSYTVTVGSGGAGGDGDTGATSGGNSVFDTITSIGGGNGGGHKAVEDYFNPAGSGGSGGGGGYPLPGAVGTAGQGYNGGSAFYPGSPPGAGGGGGGASEVGANYSGLIGGAGGDGISNSITGSAVTYAGGGGGTGTSGGLGGDGGGGAGATTASTSGGNGTDNLGGGGGGARGAIGGDGGDGVVIIRYLTPIPQCEFSGYVFDESSTALEGANVTIWNQYDMTEYYEDTTDSNGYWSYNITNSTNTYMAGAYYNNTIIGQLKPYISGTC